MSSVTRPDTRERRTGHLGPLQPGDRLQVGIHVYRQSNTQLIEDNEFCRNPNHGISVQDGGAREWTIARKTVLGNGSGGIRLITAPSVVVIGNQAHTTRPPGRRTQVGSHGSSIRPGTALLPHSSTFGHAG
jgi:hypothetical protein